MGCPAHCARPSFYPCHPCQLSACSLALGPGHAADADCYDRCALELAFYQLPASELWAQLQVSAAWMKPGQSLVTQGCQQMFLPLTVADLTSHLTAGRALLGPWLQSWEKGAGEPNFSLFWELTLGVRAQKGWLQRALTSKDDVEHVCGSLHDWLKKESSRVPCVIHWSIPSFILNMSTRCLRGVKRSLPKEHFSSLAGRTFQKEGTACTKTQRTRENYKF